MSRPEKETDREQPTPAPLGPQKDVAGSTRSPKILASHLERLAIVYVRQSSTHQVLCHRESRARQYALVDHAVALGWARDRVLVIDDDQGQSARSAEHRGGFHRLLAELTMEHVGLVLSLEMSRLARSSRDWHHLLEVCAVFGSVLGDEEGVYDPNDSNDRLLLGLKGTISEFELVTMHNRLERGKLNKAQRGELFYCVPTGYVKVTPERVDFDPDQQVQAVIRLIFDKYDELGTAYGVLHYLTDNGINLGVRPFHGPTRGQLEWRRPSLAYVLSILKHPIYAGAYVYGRRPQKRVLTAEGEQRKSGPWLPSDQWKVLKRDCLPAYITWERFLANQERVRQSRSLPNTPGAARKGKALLTGLIHCGVCGRRMRTYHHKRKSAQYSCERHYSEGTHDGCPGMKAAPIDELVARQVLLAVQPAALELSLKAAQEVQGERDRLDRHWKQDLQRARHETREAERRYLAVDPENRLVAVTLERRWEEALLNERRLAEEYDRFAQKKPAAMTAREREAIERLAADIPLLWDAPDTRPEDRKEVVRLLIEKVVVHVARDSDRVGVDISWAGGFSSRHEIVRPTFTLRQQRDFSVVVGRIQALRREGKNAKEIAAVLNQEGFVPPRRRGKFTGEAVRQILHRYPESNGEPEADRLGSCDWHLKDLAEEIGSSTKRLSEWAEKGWLHGRKSMLNWWIVWADADEIRRLKELLATWRPGRNAYPVELTTPKERPPADGPDPE